MRACSYMWLKMATVAQEKIVGGESDPFYANKLTTGRYFIARILPDADAHLAKLKTGAETLMALPADAF